MWIRGTSYIDVQLMLQIDSVFARFTALYVRNVMINRWNSLKHILCHKRRTRIVGTHLIQIGNHVSTTRKPLNFVELSHVVYSYISMTFGCTKLQHKFVADNLS